MGYGTEQGLGILTQGIKPYSDTIRYENPKPAGFEPYQSFDINEGLVKGMRRGDTLFFQPNVPQNLREFAGLNYTDIQKSIKPENLVLKDKPYFSFKKKGGYKMKKGGFSMQDYILDHVFGDDKTDSENTAPSEEEIQAKEQEQYEAGQREAEKKYQKLLKKQQGKQLNDELINSILNFSGEESTNSYTNPYRGTTTQGTSVSVDESNYVPTVSKAIYNGPKAKQMMDYLQQQYNLPKHVAAGITGNAQQESSFLDSVIQGSRKGDDGSSFGLFQWYKDPKKPKNDRITPLLQWAKQNNRNPYDMFTQIDYGMYEAKQRGDLQAMMKSRTASEAANIWRDRFEIPAVKDLDRAKYAEDFMNLKVGGTYDVDIPTLLKLQRQGYKYKFI